jgi:hypothetical protein
LDIWSLGGSIRCVGKEESATECHSRLMEEGMGKRKIRARERQVDKMKPTRAIFLDDTKQTKRWGPFFFGTCDRCLNLLNSWGRILLEVERERGLFQF